MCFEFLTFNFGTSIIHVVWPQRRFEFSSEEMFNNRISFYVFFAVHIPKCFSTVTTYQKCTLSSSLSSRIYSDRRLLGYGIEWFQPSGFCECMERCYNYGNCYSINYNRIKLNCTINAQKAEGSVTMETAEGWEYVDFPDNFTDVSMKQ